VLLERLLLWGLRVAVVVAALWLLRRAVRNLPPWPWLWWGLRSARMRRVLATRGQIARLAHDKAGTPDAIGLLCDVDALVDSVVEMLQVRADLGPRDGMTTSGDVSARLQAALRKVDAHLDTAQRRLDDIRATLLEFAADRLHDALADARTRFHERAEQLGYTVDAHKELQEELEKLRSSG